MDLKELKEGREALRKRLEEVDNTRQKVLSKLCRLNAQYSTIRQQYLCFDQEIAEHYVEEVKTSSKSRPKDLISEVDNLTSTQVEALAARIKQMQEDKEQLKRNKEEEDSHV